MVMVVDMIVLYTFNMFDNIKYMLAGGWRHRGRQGQHGEGNQEGQWQIGCITSFGIFFNWMWHAVAIVVDMQVFLYFQHVWQH